MNKKYYWIQLPKDFFTDKVMKKIRKLPGGDAYTIITLKILLLGLDNSNKIFYDGVENTFAEEIAMEIDEDPVAVDVTVNFLLSCGWLIRESEDVIFSPKGAELTKAESSSAERVRRHRERSKALQCNTDVTLCNADVTKCNIEIEKEIENTKESIDNKEESIFSDKSSNISSSYPTPQENLGIPATKTQEIFINFPLLGGSYAAIPEDWCDKQQELFGESVNVRAEIKLAMAWCESNHLKKDWKKFLNNWFSNSLAHGGSKIPYVKTESASEIQKRNEDYEKLEARRRDEEEVAAMMARGEI